MAGYFLVLYKDFELAFTHRNAVFSIKMGDFETVKHPKACSEPCRTKSSILDIRLGSEHTSETPVPLIHKTRIQFIILKKWLLTCHF